MEKGEIAHYEQFFLFPQCFQKTCNIDMLKQGLVWERVKRLENNAGKGKKAGFIHFPIPINGFIELSCTGSFQSQAFRERVNPFPNNKF